MAYFSCGRNMTRTSNALFIHKTTLFYRFERMEKLVGPFLQQPKRLFLYEYSLHLLHEITPYPGV
jgi:DNA-binding PucR family transcriptional regulator